MNSVSKKISAVSAALEELIGRVSLKPPPARVAARAYEHWQSSGCSPGRELENWMCAEKELFFENARRIRR